MYRCAGNNFVNHDDLQGLVSLNSHQNSRTFILIIDLGRGSIVNEFMLTLQPAEASETRIQLPGLEEDVSF